MGAVGYQRNVGQTLLTGKRRSFRRGVREPSGRRSSPSKGPEIGKGIMKQHHKCPHLGGPGGMVYRTEESGEYAHGSQIVVSAVEFPV